jgi:adenosylcobinamide-GDP ribazoletransferase
MHLDGYMDCCDAILSRRDLPERQRILKDPHAGTFAVVCLTALALLEFSLFASFDLYRPLPLLLMPAASRSCSAIAVFLMKPMDRSSYAGAFLEGRKKSGSIFPIVMLAAAVALPAVFGGGLAVLGTAAGSALALLHGSRRLGGMSGDVSGYAITVGEACGLLVMAAQTCF